jgi:Ran GTPase-activating protein (RanGAP) involved in mRNA processing and transport
MTALKDCPALQTIKLCHNKIDGQGGTALAGVWKEMKSLASLDMFDNNISNMVHAILAKALSVVHPKIEYTY